MATSLRTCANCSTPLPEQAQFCMHCGVATPTDPGVPQRTATTGVVEVAKVTKALAGRYKVERVLGEGGMATVYLAEDLKHKRKVAVKVMRPELAATLGGERFLREVEIAGRLSHPHILPMYDSGESEGVLYYVMPYVEGETLRDRLQREGSLPVDDALRLAREIAEALAYAHRRNIVHRDIKPANILLNEGHALVADFGIARAVGEGGSDVLTKTGFSVGTPQYMAPEQATGEREVDGRSDVYATGAMLYEMLAGEPPFTGPSARVILTRSLTEAPRALTGVRQGLAPAVNDAVQKAMAKDPADRFATAELFAAALDSARQERTTASTPSMTNGSGGAGAAAASRPRAGAGVTAGAGASATGTGESHGDSRGALRAESLADAGPVGTDARVAPIVPARWLTLRNLAIAGVAALILWAVGATVLASRNSSSGGGSAAGNRVAVLPFHNQGSASDEYFADGIADEVRGKLSRVSGLAVIASSSASLYKGSTKAPRDIARELGADYLLVGTVRWATGDGGKRRVQVVPELIDARSGDVKWQQSFDNDITDVFEVQSQIAARVAGALGVALAGNEQTQIARRPTANVEAYQLYLKGRAVTGGDPASLRESSTFLEQAIALDSTFADAWSLLTIAQSRLYNNGNGSPEVARRAKDAFDRLMTLDPNSANAHAAASRYYRLVLRDPTRSKAELDLALRAAPSDAEVLAAAGISDVTDGDFGSALAKLERAREIDPRSYSTLYNLVQTYVYLGRDADAEATATMLLTVRPGDLNGIQWLAISRMAQGNVKGAQEGLRSAMASGVTAPAIAAHFSGYQETSWFLEEREWQLVFRLTPAAFDNDRAWWGQALATAYWQHGDAARARVYADSSLPLSLSQADGAPKDAQLRVLYGLMLAYAGKATEARAAVQKALTLHSGTQDNYMELNAARVETVLGNTEAAVQHLEATRKMGSYLSPKFLALDPTFKSLHGHPAFEKLLQK